MTPRRKPTVSELAEMVPIAQELEARLVAEGEEADDRAFALSIDRNVTEPLRRAMRAAAAVWTEPYLGMLSLCLGKCDRPTDRLYNGKLKREKALVELGEVVVDLRKLPEMVR